MEQHTIIYIQNTSEEYRKYARQIMDILEYLIGLRANVEKRDEALERAITQAEAQIRELTNIADSMQEIVFNYQKMQRAISYADIDFGTMNGGREFGVSEFANLSEHEDLIPIHTS